VQRIVVLFSFLRILFFVSASFYFVFAHFYFVFFFQNVFVCFTPTVCQISPAKIMTDLSHISERHEFVSYRFSLFSLLYRADSC